MDDDDILYCNEEEEKWGDDFVDSIPAVDLITNQQQHLLISLLSKEKEKTGDDTDYYSSSSLQRREAVEWILKVNSYYGFSTLTAILAVNYLDRFLLASTDLQHFEKPWVIHLASVSCLSLAAKVEETFVPLLLDFQVESKYVFEAKAIQKMELLMLSTLKWRMNVVTPLSFFEHLMTSLGLKKNNNGGTDSDFLRRFERLLLSVVVDWRIVRFEASVLATSSMLHVIHEIEPCNNVVIDLYHNKLLNLLNISKMKVKECSELISEIVSSSKKSKSNSSSNICNGGGLLLKRKNNVNVPPSSPNGVIDASYLCTTSDADADVDVSSSSNDSWAVSSSPLKKKIRIQEQQMRVSSSPLKKKIRIQEQQMRLPSLPLNNNKRVFLEVVGSPH